MSHKRVVKKRGKTYGPYLYESYRDEYGNVKKRYLGKVKDDGFGAPNFSVFAIIGVVLLLAFLLNFNFTGSVISVDNIGIDNGILSGNLEFVLQQSELLPENTNVIISTSSHVYSYSLSEILNAETAEGEFFLKDFNLSGYGSGYGLSLERFPSVDFVLGVYDVSQGRSYEVPETSDEEEQDSGSRSIPEEILDIEMPEETETQQTPEETTGTRSLSITGMFTMTGYSVLELNEEVNGSVKYGEEFVYDINSNQQAEIISSTEEVNLNIENGEAIVTTDYIGDESIVYSINLDELDIPVESGILNISFVYDNEILMQASKEITIDTQSDESSNGTRGLPFEPLGENESLIGDDNLSETSDRGVLEAPTHNPPWLGAHNRDTSGLVGEWRFENGNATFTEDETGVNNGSVSGATLTNDGRVGRGYSFDGNSDYINLSESIPNFEGLSQGSFSAWVKLDIESADYDVIFSASDSGDASSEIVFWVDATNHFGIQGREAGEVVFNSETSAADGPDQNIWYHIVAVSDGTNAPIIYVNGEDLTEVSTGSGFFSDINDLDFMAIGMNIDSGGNQWWWNGLIDEVSIWNRTLTSTEISELYNTSKGAYGYTDNDLGCSVNASSDVELDDYTAIYNWYLNGSSIAVLNMPFEAGSNDTHTKDYSSFGNDGAVTNAVWNATGGHDGFGAYEFDGEGDYVNASDLGISGEQNVTISAWAKLVGDGLSFPAIMASGYSGQNGFVCSSFCTNVIFKGESDLSNKGVFIDLSSYNISEWNLYTGVSTSSGLYLYINGELVNSSSVPEAAPINITSDYQIGSTVGSSSRVWNGSIDEVLIFNRSLSPEQIKSIYESGLRNIVSEETERAENWGCEVTLSDATDVGETYLSSSNITLENSVPTHSYPWLGAHNRLTSGLVGEWRFENGNATFTEDETGVNNGSVSGATLTNDGRVGRGYSFDGVNDNIEVVNDPSINFSTGTPFTVSVWINPAYTTLGGASKVIVSKKNYSETVNGWDLMSYHGTGYIYFRIFNSSGSTREVKNYAIPTTDAWTNIVGVYNGTDITMYTNEVWGGYWTSVGDWGTNDIYFTVGDSTTYGLGWNGSIDEVSIWNRSLTATEISEMYNTSKGAYGYTDNDLGCSVNGSSDVELDDYTAIYNWYLNGSSIAVLNMPFEAGSNATYTKDYSSFGNDGAVVDATWNSTGGVDGFGAYEFDGTAQGISINYVPSLKLNSSGGSISLWVKPYSFVADTHILASYGGGSYANGWLINQQGPNLNVYWLSASQTHTISDPFTINSWTHIVVTKNDTAVTTYVDGVLKDSDPPGTNTENDLTTYIGGRGATWTFNGSIDEVQIFNRSLSAEQIKSIYESGLRNIVSEETERAENWSCEVTLADATDVSETYLSSSNITLENSVPTHSYPWLGAHNRLTSGLVGEWRFENGNATFTEDETGVNNGSVTGATLTNDGRVGRGYEFDGLYNRINMPSDEYDGGDGGNFTLSVWLNPNYRTMTGSGTMAVLTSSVTSADQFKGFYLKQIWGSYQLYACNGTNKVSIPNANAPSPIGVWSNIVIKKEGTNFSLYQNGVIMGSSLFVNYQNYSDLALGDMNYQQVNYRYNGSMDEVSIWNRSLSATEVSDLYNTTKGAYGYTDNDLGCSVNASSDVELDDYTAIYNWYLNGSSIAVLNMPFEAGSNSTYTKDYSSFGNDGVAVLNGTAQWNATGGHDGFGAYDFDGDGGDYIDGIISSSSTPITISAWIKTTQNTGTPTVVYIGDNSFNNHNILRLNSGVATVYSRDSGGNAYTGSVHVDDGEWHHVVAIWKNSTSRTVYVDGGSAITNNVEKNVNAITEYGIGRSSDSSPSDYFNGTIDEVLIFNRSLSAEQIKSIYESGLRNIVSEETERAENWSCGVTLADAEDVSETYLSSSNITLLNSVPTHSYPWLGAHNRLTSGLIGEWRFENGNATFTEDETGLNNGSVSGATLTNDGRVGRGYSFDGVNDEINVAHDESLDINTTGTFTVSAWTKVNGYTVIDTTYGIASKITPWTNGWSLTGIGHAGNVNNFGFYVANGSSIGAVSTADSSFGLWHHVTGVYNGSDALLYVNGELHKTASVINALGDNGVLTIGSLDSIGYRFLNGSIDEVSIWNRSLTSTEISEMYNTSKGAYGYTDNDLGCSINASSDVEDDSYTAIYNWYLNGSSIAVLNMPFEAGSNDTHTKDYSSFGNDGAVTNAVWNATGGHDGFGAYEFDGEGDWINLTAINDDFSESSNLSISLWTYLKDDGNNILFHMGPTASDNFYLDYIDTGYYRFVSYQNDGGYNLEQIASSINNWHHLIGTWDGANLCFYFDGDLTSACSVNSELRNFTLANFASLGSRPLETNRWLNGSIDEVLIFNRTLSAEQVKSIYESGLRNIVSEETNVNEEWSCGVTLGDVEGGESLSKNTTILPLNVTDTVPVFYNAVNTSNNFRKYENFTANITITDDLGIYKYIFATNATGNWVNTTTYLSTENYSASHVANITVDAENDVCWYYYAEDGIGQSNMSDVYCFEVNDSIMPNITINTPFNQTYNTSTIDFNITATDDILVDSCWLTLDNGVTNYTMLNTTYVDDYNFTNSSMTAGSHTAQFYCNDSTNNVNNTENITFTINSIWFETDFPLAEDSFRITDFVNVSGDNFTLGGQQYRIQGVNFYYAVDYMTGTTYSDNGELITDSDDDVYEVLNEMQYLGTNVVRTWLGTMGGNSNGTNATWEHDTVGGHYNFAINDYPGNYNETYFEAMDKFIYECSQRDIRIEGVLVNNWNAYGGMQWYLSHSSTSDKTYEDATYLSNDWWTWHDQFYTDAEANGYFQDFVNYTLNRNNTYSGVLYKDDPTIFAWFISNEPRVKSDDHSIIKNWCNDTTNYIKGIDDKHLVTCGIEGLGFNETWGEGSDITICNDTTEDFCTIALNTGQWGYMVERTETWNDGQYLCDMSSSNCHIGNANVRDFWGSPLEKNYTYNELYHSGVSYWIPQLARHTYNSWTRQNAEWANEIGKPIMLQELVVDQAYSDSTKDDLYEKVISTWFRFGGDGLMYWTLNSDSYYRDSSTSSTGNQDDGYGFYVSDDDTLNERSASTIKAFNFTHHNNTGGTSWVNTLNHYKYDFTVNVIIPPGSLINNCSLYLNISNGTWQGNSLDQTNTSAVLSGVDYVFIKDFEDDTEEFTWYIECVADDSSIIQSLTEEVVLETSTPQVDLNEPANESFINADNIDFNYTATNTLDISYCEFYIDGVLNQTDTIVTKNVKQSFPMTGTDFSEGNHTWYVFCRDVDANTDTSNTRQFTVDYTYPLINIIYPLNNTNTIDTGLDVNYTYFDINADTCWYSNDTFSENITLTDCTTNITDVVWTQGQHNVKIWINDSANNVNSSSVTFFIDSIYPLINIETPANNTNLFDVNLDVNYTYTEINPSTCWYSNDTFSENTTLASCGTNITDVVWTEGEHNVTVWINDTANNLNYSSVTFFVDSIYPLINFTSPTESDYANISYDSVYVNYSTTETNEHYSFINYDNSLVGWWRFENGNATFTEDETGVNNGSVLEAVHNSPGKFGKAYEFDGDNDYIEVGDYNVTGTDFSIFSWVNADVDDRTQDIVGYSEIIFQLGTNNDLVLYVEDMLEQPQVLNSSSAVWSVGTWHNVGISFNDTSNVASFYVDGVLAGTDTFTIGQRVDLEYNWRIGDPGQNTNFDGRIDEVMIFNRSLSPEEVVALYNASSYNQYRNFTSQTDGSHTSTAYVVDVAGNKNSTEQRTVTVDTTNPGFSFASNTSNEFKRYENFTANITIDDAHLDTYIFSTNASGSWANTTFSILGNTTYNASEQANITLSQGVSICWFYYANDTLSNENYSTEYCFIVNDTAPVMENIFINSSSGINTTTENLTCYANATDLDNNTLDYLGYWIKNNEILINETWSDLYDGGGSWDIATSIAVDSENNVYITGYSDPAGSFDIVTIKYNSSGSRIANATYDNGGTEEVKAIAIDSQDNVIVGGLSSNGNQYIVVKYNSSLDYLWDTKIQSNGVDPVTAVAVDSQDNIYFSVETDNGDGDTLFKLNSSGDYQWNATFNFTGTESPYGKVAVDSDDNIYTAGFIDTGSLVYDAYLIKHNSSGDYQWNVTYDSGGNDTFSDCDVNSRGEIYLTGYTDISGSKEYLLVKYNSSGDYQWNVTYDIPGETTEVARGMKIDNYDDIYITGDVFDSITTTVKFNSSGSQIWNKSYLGASFGIDIAVDSLGGIYVAGWPYSLQGSGNWDYFIMKYNGMFVLRNQTQGILTNISTLDSSYTSVWDNLSCRVRAYDGMLYNIYNNSGNITIIDVTNPEINITYPINNTNSSDTGLDVNYTYFDINVDSCWYSNDTFSENITLASCGDNITSVVWDEGQHNVTIWINDSANNVNSSSVAFTIDITNPEINFTTGTEDNATVFSRTWIFVNVSANDTYEDTITFNLYNNSNQLENSSSYTDATRTINWTNLGEGVYYYNVSINDSAGNENSTETRKITLDRTSPQVSITSPIASTYSSASVGIEINLNEAGYCEYSMNKGVSNSTLTNATSATKYTGSLSLGNGVYTLNAYCNDSYGNNNYTENVSFTVSIPSPPSGDTGGGGATSATIKKLASLNVVPDSLEIVTVKGIDDTRILKVTNTGDTDLSLTVVKSGEIVDIVETVPNLIIAQGETKDLVVNINSPEKGLLSGKIIFEALGSRFEVPVVINVKSENFLFDIGVSLPKEMKFISPGELLQAQIDLLQVGPQEKVDVKANYVIKDFEGNVYIEESETFYVLGEKNYIKEIYTDGLPYGKYFVGLEIVYPGAFATSSTQFEIVQPFYAGTNLILIAGALLIIAMIVSIYLLKRRRLKLKLVKK